MKQGDEPGAIAKDVEPNVRELFLAQDGICGTKAQVSFLREQLEGEWRRGAGLVNDLEAAAVRGGGVPGGAKRDQSSSRRPDPSGTENAIDSASLIHDGWGDLGIVIHWPGVGSWSRMVARSL